MFGRSFISLCLALVATVGCDIKGEGIPLGKLAVVGDVVIGPEDLSATQSQLGAYAQLRFAGPEGRRALLDAIVVAELLVADAEEKGFQHDPRIEWAIVREIAEIEMRAELERRVPRSSVEKNQAVLRAYYEGHSSEFMTEERRSAQGVLMKKFEKADHSLEMLRLGAAELDELGSIVATPLKARDDHEFFGFHPLLFSDRTKVGDWLEHPVVVGESLLVARLQKIEPASLRSFDDPKVQEELVLAVLAPKRALARAEILAELKL